MLPFLRCLITLTNSWAMRQLSVNNLPGTKAFWKGETIDFNIGLSLLVMILDMTL